MGHQKSRQRQKEARRQVRGGVGLEEGRSREEWGKEWNKQRSEIVSLLGGSRCLSVNQGMRRRRKNSQPSGSNRK